MIIFFKILGKKLKKRWVKLKIRSYFQEYDRFFKNTMVDEPGLRYELLLFTFKL